MESRFMREHFVRQQSLQLIILSVRSAINSVQKRLYRFCLTIALLSMVLNAEILLLPIPGAQAGSTGFAGVGAQIELVSKPIRNTATQPSPRVISRLREALSKQTKIPVATLKVVETTPKNWTNGCLDLERSGEICTQALVKGWRVVFANGKQRWVYRTDQQGRHYRLEP